MQFTHLGKCPYCTLYDLQSWFMHTWRHSHWGLGQNRRKSNKESRCLPCVQHVWARHKSCFPEKKIVTSISGISFSRYLNNSILSQRSRGPEGSRNQYYLHICFLIENFIIINGRTLIFITVPADYCKNL